MEVQEKIRMDGDNSNRNLKTFLDLLSGNFINILGQVGDLEFMLFFRMSHECQLIL